MKEKLNITLIQAPLEWEKPEANRNYFSEKIKSLNKETDLIILPEMFTTGFSMSAKNLAEPMNGPTVNWVKDLANKNNTAITGSIIIEEDGNFYNRLLFVFPSGKLETYDKKHLFTLATENDVYTPGKAKLIVELEGWKICPLICYDLRFPVWSRNVEDYDLLIYVANWPAIRTSAWDALLKARAIENMAYCAGVNRVGTDGKGFEYIGHSAVYDVLGEKIADLDEQEGIQHVVLDSNHLKDTREKLRFLNDKDFFILK